MADLTIVHDPDKGCLECPFYDGRPAPDRCLAVDEGLSHEPETTTLTADTAPTWCPLRSGSVVVSARPAEDAGAKGCDIPGCDALAVDLLFLGPDNLRVCARHRDEMIGDRIVGG